MMKISKLVKVSLCLSLAAVSFQSCQKEDIEEVETLDVAESVVTQVESRDAVTDKDILNKVATLNIDIGSVTQGDFHLPDGTVEQRFYIGDDIVVTETELDEMLKLGALEQNRQYRTNFLVTGSNRTIDILGYTGNDQFGLSNRARTALGWAVNNYNRLSGVSLNFRLTFGTNFNAADMVIYDNSANNSGSGGVAGFPTAQGRPHKFIQIYNLDGFSTNVNEHVITHEIGHSIGFRHSDWFDRFSCGGGGESAGSTGAVHVPGTPTGRDQTSIMNACFANNEDGEFNGNDITALRNMY